MMQRIGYRDAVARQPESLETAVRSVAEALDALDLAGFRGKTIGFAGIGASYQAALAGASYLRARGIGPSPIADRSLRRRTSHAAEAFVALSASGQSREIAEVMQLRPGAAAHRRLPGQRQSAGRAHRMRCIATDSGADNGASSTGYTGMLLAIGHAGRRSWPAAPSRTGRACPAPSPNRLRHRQARQAGGGAARRANLASISSAPAPASPPPARPRC